jgi:hypothetical protein
LRFRNRRRFIFQADEGIAIKRKFENAFNEASVGVLIVSQVAFLFEIVNCLFHHIYNPD